MWPFDSGYTSYGPGDPQYEAHVADPGALAAAANAAGRPGTENLNMSSPTWQAASAPLVQALQDAAKSSVFNPKDPPPLAAARPIDVPAGRPRQAASLDQLVQLLERQRAQYGTLSGQPVQRSQILGLLGF